MLVCLFSAALPLPADAEESSLNYIEFIYTNSENISRSYLLPIGASVRLPDILTALGLNPNFSGLQVSDYSLLGLRGKWMDFFPHQDDDNIWYAEAYQQLPSEQWIHCADESAVYLMER